ncbi:MAG: acyl carrier protein [Lachnospiraceae bacterium]|nr:acyl carrier protein [Lachnospiraceae bacterium]
MTRDEVFEEVRKIFRDNFDDDDLVVVDETNSSDIEDWDSIEHINLVIAMEKKFDLKFNIREVGKLANVGEMVDLIVSMLENKSS